MSSFVRVGIAGGTPCINDICMSPAQYIIEDTWLTEGICMRFILGGTKMRDPCLG